MKSLARYFSILIIYLILICYSLELLLFVFLPKTQKELVRVDETRLSRAIELGIDYDLRNREQAFMDESKINPNLVPAFNFNHTFTRFNYFNEALLNNQLIPFRGPINKHTLSCAEDFNYSIISNDKFGFKNPNSIYDKKIEVMILGDSYAEGLCYNENHDIAGNLRELNFNTGNFGVTGSGPLVALGVLSEYAREFRPQTLFYLYFEGNDITDLIWERNNTNLTKYLQDDYSQDFLLKEKEINNFLNKISKESYNYIQNNIDNVKNYNQNPKKDLSQQVKDILELTRLKHAIKNLIFLIYDEDFDKELFFSTINKMNMETQQWNGKFIFVYVPSWSRYFAKFNKIQRYINKKDFILDELNKTNITTIDLTKFFNKKNKVKQYFPLGLPGHFNKKGYKKIAEILEKEMIAINYQQ